MGLLWFEWTWLSNCMEMPWYSIAFRLFVCLFCLQLTLEKDTWMRATSTTVTVIFSKVFFWKLLDRNYIQSSFSAIARHIENRILKDALQLKVLRTWIKIRANSFIRTWVNIMKQNSTKVSWKLQLAKKYDLQKKLATFPKEIPLK